MIIIQGSNKSGRVSQDLLKGLQGGGTVVSGHGCPQDAQSRVLS